MIPTGGSSGQIRFAIHTWNTLMASVAGFREYFQVNQVNACCVLPLYHVSGLMQFMRSFTSDGSLIHLPFKAVEHGLENTTRFQPSECFLSLVPTQLQRLLQTPTSTAFLSQFHTVLLGGAPAWTDLLTLARQQQIRLAPTYGMTETASQVVTLQPADFLRGQTGCGQVLPHAQIIIRDQEGRSLPPNQTGLVTIQTPALALGYYPQPFTSSEFQTDDLGYFDSDGYLHLIGRNSHKIITGGENVFPIEVEAAIRSTGLVSDVCVFGLPDSEWGEAVTAAYVPTATSVTIASLQTALSDRLSRFKQPKRWIALDQIPHNAQGKANYHHLKQLFLSHSLEVIDLTGELVGKDAHNGSIASNDISCDRHPCL
jgi:O-succinylbenzoic acid--CoA ligase